MASSSNVTPVAVAGGARTGIDAANSRIQLFESSNMVMISAPLNGNNWLTWSQSVKIVLEGKR
ncbi:UNVERIFIED_CONTAM: hypothetical protein Sradi_1322100 [Sesamum radiatum]|uniref:Retrotransposon Copia-like N-terminal domain-containing protein n=1 Tax=Sesamum radiatum TaxID=300843 RepID=A0AAW2UST4_SESRA